MQKSKESLVKLVVSHDGSFIMACSSCGRSVFPSQNWMSLPTKGQLIEHFVSQWFAPSEFEPCHRCKDRAFVRRDLDEQSGAF
jgi:hypothetical protein